MDKQVGIARIYMKDMSFESPAAPGIFRRRFEPKIDLRVSVAQRQVEGDFYEVVLELNAEAKDDKGESGFIVELEQAGLFEIKGFEGAEREQVLQVFCPTNLFPYARQNIDHALVQGGFPPIMLAPISFEALYRQKQQGGEPKPE